MYTTYHFDSAEELSIDILEAIKTTFKSKPITIFVEEDGGIYDLSEEMKATLDDRLHEDRSTYLSSEESISLLNNNYGL